MKNLSLLIENALVHKESIAPTLSGVIDQKSHYNAKNSMYPDTIGRGNFMQEISTENFTRVLNRMKRSHDVADINPKTFFKVKNGMASLLTDMKTFEESKKPNLNTLAETIVRKYFSVPTTIQFEFDDTDDFSSSVGNNVIETYKDSYEDYKFEDYTGVESANQNIDRARMNYSLICGGATAAMGLYKNYEEALDTIDYRLSNLYSKFNAFNEFNLWVTPDGILTQDMDKYGGFKIYDSEGGYRIAIDAPNFLSTLFEMSKAVLSILFQEKYHNPHIDYENPWNTRIGSMAWRKLIGCASKRQNFPYVVDAMNNLADNDYSYVMKEVLAGTPHAKKIFQELYESL